MPRRTAAGWIHPMAALGKEGKVVHEHYLNLGVHITWVPLMSAHPPKYGDKLLWLELFGLIKQAFLKRTYRIPYSWSLLVVQMRLHSRCILRVSGFSTHDHTGSCTLWGCERSVYCLTGPQAILVYMQLGCVPANSIRLKHRCLFVISVYEPTDCGERRVARITPKCALNGRRDRYW